MKSGLFSRYLLILFGGILIFSIGIKIYSIMTFPNISDWNYNQLQKINKIQNNFSFAVFSDNKNSITTFENLINKVNNDETSFAIDCGDLVYDGEKEKFRFFLNQIKELNKPLLTVFGNHDAKEKGRAVYYELFGQFYYSFTVGNNYFIILDDSNEKNIDDEQFAWLKNELKTSQKYKNRFVFMHVPLYDPRGKGPLGIEFAHALEDKDFARELNKLFDDNGVTMIFASHIHAYYKGVWGKTPYIITGGAGAELAGSDPEHYFYHYIKVKVDNNSVKYELVKLKSPKFEFLDRFLHDGWIYLRSFFAIHFIDFLLLLSVTYLSIYVIIIRKKWIILNFKKKIEKIKKLKKNK